MIILFLDLPFRVYYIEYAETELEQLGTELQEMREGVEQLETELTEKSSALSETSLALADNQTLLKESVEKVSQIKDVDGIETGKTIFGGKVTVAQDDYDKLANLAKKQIAAESKESSLRSRITALEMQNQTLTAEKEQLTEQNYELRAENGKLQSVYGQMALAKLRSERDNLQRKLDKVMDFIKGLGLAERLQEFLKPRGRGIGR